MKFHEFYATLIDDALGGVKEHNARTGRGVAMLPEGASFALDLSDGVLPTVGRRLTRPVIAAAELAWCLRGDCHIDWLRKYTKVWDPFCDVKDCVQCDGGGITTKSINPNYETVEGQCLSCAGAGKTYWLNEAYGHRWRFAFGVDQLQLAIIRLRADPSDRRCWVSSWDPGTDIIPADQKTVPCPVGFTIQIMGGKLCSTLMIRSSDLFMGLPYDVMRHSLLMAAMAAEFKVGLGHARFTLANPHVYEHQWELAREIIRQKPVVPEVTMPNWPVSRIQDDPDYYVEAFKQYCSTFKWPAWNPKSEVAK